MTTSFSDIVEQRRSVYTIEKQSPLPDEEILTIIRHAVKFAPSAFNSQSARLIVLLGKDHDKLWDITLQILQERIPAEKFGPTRDKINSFKSGYGTILYFEDQNAVKSLQDKFPTYKDNFPGWSLQSSGMLQYIIWAALESEGFGVNLQHYNPIIDEKVRTEWNVPENWKLIAQMPFGKPTAPAGEKTFLPLEDRVVVYHS